ncbi:methyltransferase family protein [Streptomyces gamaensis]|uniref:Methyltransferase family protein n=1 Tax=Streptomyces gamaensis TaxID=1763542 RepID=A0ABW0Z0U5_9ACTN
MKEPDVQLPGLLALVGLLVWVGYELLLRRREDPGAASWQGGAADRGSTYLLIATYVVVVVVNVVLTSGHLGRLPAGWRWAGVGLVAAGLALRAWGMATLGRFYTRTLRTTGDQRVVREGPYRLVRHPGYCGSLLVWVGYALGLGNAIATVLTAGLLLGAYSWRIVAEERLLVAAFGEEYERYRRRTKRLVPYVY